jgi:hypothetical protein
MVSRSDFEAVARLLDEHRGWAALSVPCPGAARPRTWDIAFFGVVALAAVGATILVVAVIRGALQWYGRRRPPSRRLRVDVTPRSDTVASGPPPPTVHGQAAQKGGGPTTVMLPVDSAACRMRSKSAVRAGSPGIAGSLAAR